MANGNDGDNGQARDGGNRTVLQNGVKALQGILNVLSTSFPQITGTASSATAGAATLPANPVGFITITLPDGTQAKIPYYSP